MLPQTRTSSPLMSESCVPSVFSVTWENVRLGMQGCGEGCLGGAGDRLFKTSPSGLDWGSAGSLGKLRLYHQSEDLRQRAGGSGEAGEEDAV